MSEKREPVLEKNLFGNRCQHNKFIVDPQLATVECGLCNEKLNPMWVLERLCDKEARARRQVEVLEKTAEETRKKLRCKCEHCGKMTKIYR